jgi:hypothetical protein
VSDTVLVALITGGTTGLVGLAALAFNFWNSSRERQLRLAEHREDYREWYRRTMFEKRLLAIQKGRAWVTRLNEGLNHPEKSLPDTALLNLVTQARDWYAENAFYIHAAVPNNCPFDRLVFQLEWGLLGYGDMPDNDMWKEARDLFGAKAEELWGSLEND